MSYQPMTLDDLKQFDVILYGANVYIVKEIKGHGFRVNISDSKRTIFNASVHVVNPDGLETKISLKDKDNIYVTKTYSSRIQNMFDSLKLELL